MSFSYVGSYDKKSPHGELHPGPAVYETATLLLSYEGVDETILPTFINIWATMLLGRECSDRMGGLVKIIVSL